MLEVAHILIATFQWQIGEMTLPSYDACWEQSEIIWQEKEYWSDEKSGQLIMTACVPTLMLTVAPAPEMRPT